MIFLRYWFLSHRSYFPFDGSPCKDHWMLLWYVHRGIFIAVSMCFFHTVPTAGSVQAAGRWGPVHTQFSRGCWGPVQHGLLLGKWGGQQILYLRGRWLFTVFIKCDLCISTKRTDFCVACLVCLRFINVFSNYCPCG